MLVLEEKEFSKGEDIVATIGFFDGVHVGHQYLIDQVKEIATVRHLSSMVITFPQYPPAVLQPGYQPKLLNSFEEKLELLDMTDIDYCLVLNFTKALSRLTAQEFITRILWRKFQVTTLVIGHDHHFGRDRKDSFEQYAAYGSSCGMEVIKALPYEKDGTVISSSGIRRLLTEGRIEKAWELLTYPYCLEGTIIDGYKIGRQLGFPTANIRPNDPCKMLPGVGVYAGWVYVGEDIYKGMIYIGSRPTLNNGDEISLEVHLLDFSRDIYSKNVIIFFNNYIREDIKFDSLDQLKEQLKKDEEIVENLLDAPNF